MHATRRDQLTFRAKLAEVVLIVCSTIFCVTTFAGQELFNFFAIDPSTGRIILGIASVSAFVSSLILLIVDWKGAASLHGDAVRRWSAVLELFRSRRNNAGIWLEQYQAELSAAYWEAAHNSVPIPERHFNRLKACHLQKVETSKIIDRHPWCPQILLRTALRFRDSFRALNLLYFKKNR
jgi:hypothetical protein